MKAVLCDGVGEASVMRLGEVARPVPLAGQVLIKVHASGVNRPDVLQRSGKYAPPADASPILGLEVAGEIVAGDLGDYKIGDSVCALTHGGGYAEYVLAERKECLPVPRGWTMAEAASLPETFFTVWFNVFERAHLGRDKVETLLVHAGASGIGVAAIQMARAMGQTVWVTAGAADKREACVRLGATGALDYRNADWCEKFLAATQQKGADVVLDMVGGESLGLNLKVMSHGGRLAWIAFLGGHRAEVSIPDIMAREITLTGSFLRRQPREVKACIAKKLREHIWPKIEKGDITAVIDRIFKVEDVVLAHQHMESNVHIGKIVLQW
ncbi:NAD(P)H-quinone oxidoreductase [Hydromonas duriensis]